jgi:hypothetical protein
MNAVAVSLVLLVFSALELFHWLAWQAFGALACGVWLAASPFFIEYSGEALQYGHFTLGMVLSAFGAFNLWMGRARTIDTAPP